MSTLVVDDQQCNVCSAPSVRRVLLVTQASGGGVGRHFLDLAAGLTRRGVEVVGVYSPRKLDQSCRQRLADIKGREASTAGMKAERQRDSGAPSLPSCLPAFKPCPDASMPRPLLLELPMRRAVHPLDVVGLMRLVKLTRRLGPFDVIHGHSSKGGALARLAARIVGTSIGGAVVFTPNALITMDPALRRWERTLYGRIEQWLAAHTDAIIAVSDDERKHALEQGFAADKLHVIPNGIEPPNFPSRDSVRHRLGIAQQEVVVGFVGRLAHQKAPDVMLECFAIAADRLPQLRLVMIGSGPLEQQVAHQCQQLQLKDRVLMLGDVTATEIMPAFDLFCLSSRFEGMPYVYAETLAAALPIVTTRVGGATMAVEPEVNGFIVPIDDPQALASAIERLATGADLRRQFGTASLARSAAFHVDTMVDATLAVYQQVREAISSAHSITSRS